MATHLNIFSQKDILTFDTPPEFNGETRKKFFSVPVWTRETLASFRTPTNELLKEEADYINGEKRSLKLKRYRLTLLKKSYQSIRPSKIKENVNDLKSLHTLFRELKPVIDRIGLSSEIIQYYAQVVIKSKVFQMRRREEKRAAYVIDGLLHNDVVQSDIHSTDTHGYRGAIHFVARRRSNGRREYLDFIQDYVGPRVAPGIRLMRDLN